MSYSCRSEYGPGDLVVHINQWCKLTGNGPSSTDRWPRNLPLSHQNIDAFVRSEFIKNRIKRHIIQPPHAYLTFFFFFNSRIFYLFLVAPTILYYPLCLRQIHENKKVLNLINICIYFLKIWSDVNFLIHVTIKFILLPNAP